MEGSGEDVRARTTGLEVEEASLMDNISSRRSTVNLPEDVGGQGESSNAACQGRSESSPLSLVQLKRDLALIG